MTLFCVLTCTVAVTLAPLPSGLVKVQSIAVPELATVQLPATGAGRAPPSCCSSSPRWPRSRSASGGPDPSRRAHRSGAVSECAIQQRGPRALSLLRRHGRVAPDDRSVPPERLGLQRTVLGPGHRARANDRRSLRGELRARLGPLRTSRSRRAGPAAGRRCWRVLAALHSG